MNITELLSHNEHLNKDNNIIENINENINENTNEVIDENINEIIDENIDNSNIEYDAISMSEVLEELHEQSNDKMYFEEIDLRDNEDSSITEVEDINKSF